MGSQKIIFISAWVSFQKSVHIIFHPVCKKMNPNFATRKINIPQRRSQNIFIATVSLGVNPTIHTEVSRCGVLKGVEVQGVRVCNVAEPTLSFRHEERSLDV